ncbi:hypothetical protein E2986_04937 [Frieseomelitta varia]|uniref:J domain-containing protein n=1 Tax=Frieseomelitta varia TaxID=561572 RepID=A0A833RUK6_9HYME|nr:hypothetical protein E2986_04937 [Frieseomelitta varia]
MFIHASIINVNKSIKCISKSVLLVCTKTTKAKTHYEVLGVETNATYNEIKSAYYKLTLKYHPDKNKSESAREMFHEISEAYDILSKYDTRKQYDRTILIKEDLDRTKHKYKYKTEHVSQYTDKLHTAGKPMKKIFDFDMWLKLHYSNLARKTFEKNMKTNSEERNPYSMEIDYRTICFLIVVFSIGIYINNCIENYKFKQFKAERKKENKK